MRCHTYVKAGTSGFKSLLLSIVLASYQAHEFAHDIAMEVRRAKRVPRDGPPRRENDEVRKSYAWGLSGRRENCEDRRVRMVKRYRVHRAKLRKVVFEWRIVAVPSHHVERREFQRDREQSPHQLLHHCETAVPVFKPGDRCLKVPWIGKTVGPNGAQVGQLEVPIKDLQHVAAARPVRQPNREAVPALNHRDLARGDANQPALRDDVERPELRDDEEVPVGVAHAAVVHTVLGCVNVDGIPLLAAGAAGARDREETPHKVHRARGGRERAPAQLVGGDGSVPEVAHDGLHREVEGVEGVMGHRRARPVEPRPLVAPSWHGESRSRDLFRIQPIWTHLQGSAGKLCPISLRNPAQYFRVGACVGACVLPLGQRYFYDNTSFQIRLEVESAGKM
mmetsp:Transcript_16292/g.38653  ORF Transcript_16292/g.38653 Transcript_16292/m.38653 type:complete len:393 (+) Transcript_16292:403-1581(+)